MGAGVGFLVAVEDRVRELERLVRSPLIEPPLVQRLADSVRAQLSRREGDASSLVAANEKQAEEMAKLTELLRTIDTVRDVDSSPPQAHDRDMPHAGAQGCQRGAAALR